MNKWEKGSLSKRCYFLPLIKKYVHYEHIIRKLFLPLILRMAFHCRLRILALITTLYDIWYYFLYFQGENGEQRGALKQIDSTVAFVRDNSIISHIFGFVFTVLLSLCLILTVRSLTRLEQWDKLELYPTIVRYCMLPYPCSFNHWNLQ